MSKLDTMAEIYISAKSTGQLNSWPVCVLIFRIKAQESWDSFSLLCLLHTLKAGMDIGKRQKEYAGWGMIPKS